MGNPPNMYPIVLVLLWQSFLTSGDGYEEPSTQEEAAAGYEGIHYQSYREIIRAELHLGHP